MTNGPYVMTEWVHGDSLDLARNPHWPLWGSAYAGGNIERLHGVMIEEQSTAFALYEDNELDTAAVPLEQIERVREEMPEQFVNAPVNCTSYISFVTTKAPVTDPGVRRALSMAVDRRTLVDQVLRGGEIPANAFTNPLNFGSAALDPEVAPWALDEEAGGTGYAAALEMARELMVEAGYPEGEGLDLRLLYPEGEDEGQIAQALQSMWQTVFPQIDVDLETQEWGVVLQTIDKQSPLAEAPHLFLIGWCADYPHANNWLYEVFHTEGGINFARMDVDDAEVGALVQRYNELTGAARTAAPEEAIALYREAEQLLVDQIAAIVPLYYPSTANVTKPWLARSYNPGRLHLFQWHLDAEAKAGATR